MPRAASAPPQEECHKTDKSDISDMGAFPGIASIKHPYSMTLVRHLQIRTERQIYHTRTPDRTNH